MAGRAGRGRRAQPVHPQVDGRHPRRGVGEHTIQVAIERGEGIHVWDVEGNQYMDFIAGYGATSQGHVHPKIFKAFVEQASKVTLTSRAMMNT